MPTDEPILYTSGPCSPRSRRWEPWLCTLLLVIAGCGGSPERRSAAPLPTLLIEARGALERGDVVQARRIFASLESPEQPASLRGMARLGLGRCALASGNTTEAIRHLEVARKILDSGAQRARALLYLGEAQLRSGATNTGLNHLENAYTALSDAEDRSRAAYLITNSLDHLGDPVPALYRNAAGNHDFPEYSSIWLKPAVISIVEEPVKPPPTVKPAVTRLTPPPRIRIQQRTSWNARPVRTGAVQPMSRPDRITVHHTADQPAIASIGLRNPQEYLQRIQQYCQSPNLKWGDIGYHYLISSDGRIWEGRPIRYQGAHAGNNSLNRGNIGIALIGNFDEKRPSSKQVESLGSLLGALSSLHKIRPTRIYSHKDLRDTGCPGKHLQSILSTLVANLNRSDQARRAR